MAVAYGGTSAGSYYGLDALGRVVMKYQRTDSINYLVESTYNLANEITSLTYPLVPGASDRRTVNFSYDSAARVSSLLSSATSYAAAASVSVVSQSIRLVIPFLRSGRLIVSVAIAPAFS